MKKQPKVVYKGKEYKKVEFPVLGVIEDTAGGDAKITWRTCPTHNCSVMKCGCWKK